MRVQSFLNPSIIGLEAYVNELKSQINYSPPISELWSTISCLDSSELDFAFVATSLSSSGSSALKREDSDISPSPMNLSITVSKERDANSLVASPFAEGNVVDPSLSYSIGSIDEELDLTVENVDSVLNEVRPYLIADGGNVTVAKIDLEKRNIYLNLQGACGSCPSSTVRAYFELLRIIMIHILIIIKFRIDRRQCKWEYLES